MFEAISRDKEWALPAHQLFRGPVSNQPAGAREIRRPGERHRRAGAIGWLERTAKVERGVPRVQHSATSSRHPSRLCDDHLPRTYPEPSSKEGDYRVESRLRGWLNGRIQSDGSQSCSIVSACRSSVNPE